MEDVGGVGHNVEGARSPASSGAAAVGAGTGGITGKLATAGSDLRTLFLLPLLPAWGRPCRLFPKPHMCIRIHRGQCLHQMKKARSHLY